MHILIIPSWYSGNLDDVNGSFFREQAIALRKSDYKVGVIAPIFRSMRDVKGLFTKGCGTKYQNDAGVDTYRYHTINIPKLRGFERFRWTNIGLSLYKKYVKNHGVPDLVHVHSMINGGFLAYEIKKKFNVPYVITEHSTAFARGLVRQKLDKKIKEICQQASSLTCVSTPFKKLLENRYGFKFSVLFNIVDKLFFEHPISIRDENTFTFINVAFMDEKKNQALLIETFAKQFKNTNKKLVLIGNGALENTLKELTVKLEINKQVFFLGRLSREEVCAEMLKADCFVLTSNYETFGVVLIEALASGLPLIATKCGGPEDIVNSSNGILIDVNNQMQLESAMIQMVNNYKLYDKEKLRTEAQDRFGEKVFVDNALSFYKKGIIK